MGGILINKCISKIYRNEGEWMGEGGKAMTVIKELFTQEK